MVPATADTASSASATASPTKCSSNGLNYKHQRSDDGSPAQHGSVVNSRVARARRDNRAHGRVARHKNSHPPASSGDGSPRSQQSGWTTAEQHEVDPQLGVTVANRVAHIFKMNAVSRELRARLGLRAARAEAAPPASASAPTAANKQSHGLTHAHQPHPITNAPPAASDDESSQPVQQSRWTTAEPHDLDINDEPQDPQVRWLPASIVRPSDPCSLCLAVLCL